MTTTIDLTFFAGLDDGNDGGTCFGGGDGFESEPHTFNPAGVSVTRQGRRGTFEATVIFRALTEETVEEVAAVYGLHTFGDFLSLPSGWPPSEVSTDAVDNDAILRMSSWEMGLNNHNPSDLMDACLGDGLFSLPKTDGENDWHITVSLDE